MVRLKDIASRTRLSVSTVSAILNTRDPRYNGVTRTRVMKVAKTLGYRTNRHAQMLRHGRTGLVGVVHPDLSTQVSTIAKNHLIRELRQKGWQPLEYNARWFENDLRMGLRATFDHLLEARIEGLVLVRPSSWLPRSEVTRIRNAGIPMVSQHGISVPGTPQIGADVRGAIRDLTWHMVRLGHRHLQLLTRGFCEAPVGVVDRPILERIHGFQEAIQQAKKQGWSVRGEVVQEPLTSPPSNSSAMGQRAMAAILRRPNRPDAVLCTNDFWALGAMRACSQAGLRVPHDMALTGFDNEFFGQFLPSSLTTVQQPDREEARCAVELLSRLIRGERLPRQERTVILPCELVIRESCGAHTSARHPTSSEPVERGGNGGNHAMENLDLPDSATSTKE